MLTFPALQRQPSAAAAVLQFLAPAAVQPLVLTGSYDADADAAASLTLGPYMVQPTHKHSMLYVGCELRAC